VALTSAYVMIAAALLLVPFLISLGTFTDHRFDVEIVAWRSSRTSRPSPVTNGSTPADRSWSLGCRPEEATDTYHAVFPFVRP
jgi:hypothetical protein